jgi:phage/plasmid-like protein (TIGR03299 family)
MSANVETMFTLRVPAWHGLGLIIEDAPNSADALRIAGLDWQVKMGDAMLQTPDGQLIKTDKKVTYRDSDNAILGVGMSENYTIVQNNEAFAFTDELIGTGDVRYETAGSLDGGKKVWMLAQMPDFSVLGDKMESYLLFSNSHDGSSSVKVTMTNIRVVCQNTLQMALSGAKRQWSFVHKGDFAAKVHEAQVTLANANKYNELFVEEAERVAKMKISGEQLKKFMDFMFPIEDDGEYTERKAKNQMYLREAFLKAHNMDDLGNIKWTAYGLYNAASDFITHTEPLRKTSTYQERLLGSFISGNVFLDKTYDYILDQFAA